MKDMEKTELSIGEVGVINGKTVLCVKVPEIGDALNSEAYVRICDICAFCKTETRDCPICDKSERTDKTDVYYPEIKKGL